MTIKLIHVSDIHFGSGESHGKINPATGLNVRLEDFVKALEKVVDYSIEEKADAFLFSGDAYKTASPEPIYQKMFASQLQRLAEHEIKTILVVGNHDQIMRSTSSHAMSVFQSLKVPGLLIVDKPMLKKIDTRSGAFQLIGLPHVTRHNLMTLDKYSNYSAAQIDAVLVEHVSDLLRGYYEELDPEIPTVTTAHMSLDKAVAGIEEELLVGYTLTFPADMLIDKRVDYVALGHIHKHQVIRKEQPVIVYAGSLERVDFGEEREDKGFILVDLKRNETRFEFHSISPRPFVTVEADLMSCEDPTALLLEKISKAVVPGCVLRCRYKIDQERSQLINEKKLLAAASDCLTVRLQPEIVVDRTRGRVPELTETSVSSPISALSMYLDEVDDHMSSQRKERLVARAKDVIDFLNAESDHE